MLVSLVAVFVLAVHACWADAPDPEVRRAIDEGLEYLANAQARNGRWEADQGSYPVAMTALAGMTFLLDGNTTMQGRYALNVQRTTGYLLEQSQPNGLIGNPHRDAQYMYGHGFAMLFLSQVLGEEEDVGRRRQIVDVLTRAVEFSGGAQTSDGGWGDLTARDGNNYDEGSVSVTQIQGLRGCRNAGIAVPKQLIERGIHYIERCTDADGGVRFSLSFDSGVYAPLAAAAVACLYNAGEYENPLGAKLIGFADRNLPATIEHPRTTANWHYAHYYYSQVVYRLGDARWVAYRSRIYPVILRQQKPDGCWREGHLGPVFATSLNLAILQIDNNYLPIYQR